MERTILIVDDDPALLELAAVSLAPLGRPIHAVSDARAALAVMRDGRPDLLVLDLRLPGTSGLELLDELGRTPGLEGLRVLVLTAWAQREELDRARALGATEVMTKPYRPSDLCERAAALLGGT